MKPQQLPIPSRESSSTNQISQLLAITHAMQPYLILPPKELIGPDAPIHMDGGTVSAAAATFIKTCGRIDELLDDKTRWNLESQDALYTAIVETHEAQKIFLQVQTSAAASFLRPAYQYRPSLMLVQGPPPESKIFYAATYGDLTSNGVVIGYGETPESALLDFDSAFQRQAHEQRAAIAQNELPNRQSEKPKRNLKK